MFTTTLKKADLIFGVVPIFIDSQRLFLTGTNCSLIPTLQVFAARRSTSTVIGIMASLQASIQKERAGDNLTV